MLIQNKAERLGKFCLYLLYMCKLIADVEVSLHAAYVVTMIGLIT